MAQIENYEGVTNADSIAAVDGVDVLLSGHVTWDWICLSVRKNGPMSLTMRSDVLPPQP